MVCKYIFLLNGLIMQNDIKSICDLIIGMPEVAAEFLINGGIDSYNVLSAYLILRNDFIRIIDLADYFMDFIEANDKIPHLHRIFNSSDIEEKYAAVYEQKFEMYKNVREFQKILQNRGYEEIPLLIDDNISKFLPIEKPSIYGFS